MPDLNPLALIQQGQPASRDTNIPGAGYGFLQGYNDSIARNQAQDFLSSAAQLQGMEMADAMQKHLRFAAETPLHLQGKQLQNEGLNQTNTQLGLQNKKMTHEIRNLEEESRREKISFMGSHAKRLGDLASTAGPMVAQQYLNEVGNTYKQLYGVDPDPRMMQYSPDVQNQFNIAAQIHEADIKYKQNQSLQQEKLTTAKQISEQENQAKDKMNMDDNATLIAIQKMKGGVEESLAKGKLTEPQFWEMYLRARAKDPTARDNFEKMLAEHGGDIIARMPAIKEGAKTAETAPRVRESLRGIYEGAGKQESRPEGNEARLAPKPPQKIQDWKDLKRIRGTKGATAVDAQGDTYSWDEDQQVWIRIEEAE